MLDEAGQRPALSEILSATDWYQGLREKDRQLVQRTSSEKWVNAGEPFIRAGDASAYWIGIAEGMVEMYVVGASGRDTVLTCLSEGEWWGEGSLLKREPRRYHVIALRRSRLVLVPIETFMHLRDTDIGFNHHLQDLMNGRISTFVGTLEADRLLSPERRVAKCLQRLCGTDPAPNPMLAIQQQDLALICGLSRQRVNAALGVLEALGHIRVEFKSLTVLNLPGLDEYSMSA